MSYHNISYWRIKFLSNRDIIQGVATWDKTISIYPMVKMRSISSDTDFQTLFHIFFWVTNVPQNKGALLSEIIQELTGCCESLHRAKAYMVSYQQIFFYKISWIIGNYGLKYSCFLLRQRYIYRSVIWHCKLKGLMECNGNQGTKGEGWRSFFFLHSFVWLLKSEVI